MTTLRHSLKCLVSCVLLVNSERLSLNMQIFFRIGGYLIFANYIFLHEVTCIKTTGSTPVPVPTERLYGISGAMPVVCRLQTQHPALAPLYRNYSYSTSSVISVTFCVFGCWTRCGNMEDHSEPCLVFVARLKLKRLESYVIHNVCAFIWRKCYEKTFILNAKYSIEYRDSDTSANEDNSFRNHIR
jgi:hypothetical protein